MRSVEKPYPSVKGKKRGFYNRVVLSIFRVKNPTRNPEIFGLQTRTQLNGNSTDLTRFHCDSTSVDEKTISDIFRHEGAVQDRRNVRSHELELGYCESIVVSCAACLVRMLLTQLA
jgi:hypothetical protein